jgi:hypothetical protein
MPMARTAAGPASPSWAARRRPAWASARRPPKASAAASLSEASGSTPRKSLQVGGGGVDAAARAEEQRQALDLLARDAALLGQAGDEQVQGVGVQADLVLGQRLADQAGHVAGLVLVAGDDGAGGGLLAGLAQGGVAAQRAGLDQEEGVGIELAGGMAGQRLGGALSGPAFSPVKAQPHQPAAAHQRLGGSSPSSRPASPSMSPSVSRATSKGSSGRRSSLGQLVGAVAHHARSRP